MIRNKKELKVQEALGLLCKRSYFLTVHTIIEHSDVAKGDFYLLKVFVEDKWVLHIKSILSKNFARIFPSCVSYKLEMLPLNQYSRPHEAIAPLITQECYIWIFGDGPQDFIEIKE